MTSMCRVRLLFKLNLVTQYAYCFADCTALCVSCLLLVFSVWPDVMNVFVLRFLQLICLHYPAPPYIAYIETTLWCNFSQSAALFQLSFRVSLSSPSSFPSPPQSGPLKPTTGSRVHSHFVAVYIYACKTQHIWLFGQHCNEWQNESQSRLRSNLAGISLQLTKSRPPEIGSSVRPNISNMPTASFTHHTATLYALTHRTEWCPTVLDGIGRSRTSCWGLRIANIPG